MTQNSVLRFYISPTFTFDRSVFVFYFLMEIDPNENRDQIFRKGVRRSEVRTSVRTQVFFVNHIDIVFFSSRTPWRKPETVFPEIVGDISHPSSGMILIYYERDVNVSAVSFCPSTVLVSHTNCFYFCLVVTRGIFLRPKRHYVAKITVKDETYVST